MPVYRQLESADLVSSETFFSMPLHVRDRHVGNFFLMSLAAGGAHSGKDREVLELLTTLAATAIANARAYRHEQRARSDLEAMVRTSPVGVVVFDARIGDVALLNQEAMRLTRGLQMPQHSPEQFMEGAVMPASGRAGDSAPRVSYGRGASCCRDGAQRRNRACEC